MLTMYTNYVCFTNFPKIGDLICVFASISTPENVNTSYYNLTIKKCRQLIFENNNVLAYPNLEQIYGIHIVIKETDYETGELQKYLSTHNLKARAPIAVTKFIYEDCCLYTFIAKLAPKWNLVSNYFVGGRDFLTASTLKDCVRLSLCINDKGETSMNFEVSKIRLPNISLNKLDFAEKSLNELKEKNVLHFKRFDSKIIRVLPSLKRGHILSVNLKINQTWSLKNYQQFRRHWKNTYGYRLPETEEDIFYLEISFFDGSPVFTYPSLCVRPYEPTFIQRVDPQPVIAAFISDLMRSVPNILGDKYPVPSHLNKPVYALYSGTQNLEYPNSCKIYTQSKKILDSQKSAIVYLPTQKVDECDGEEPRTKLSQLLSQLNKTENKTPIYLTQKSLISQKLSPTPDTKIVKQLSLDENNTQIDKIHHLTSKQSSVAQEIKNQIEFLSTRISQRTNMSPKKVESTENNSSKKYVPVFTSKFPKIKKFKNIPPSILKTTEVIEKTKEINSPNAIENSVEIHKNPEFKKSVENTLEKNNNFQKRQIVKNNSQSPVAKKPKIKAEVKVVNNMEDLVKNGTINKLNVQTLLRWLKDRDIYCTTKEKKSDLIQKVLNAVTKK